MSTITELSPQKRRKDRYNLYLDGSFFCGINRLSIVKNHLKTGMEIDGEELRRAVFESECTDAFERGADYLSRGRRTEGELSDYLAGRGFDDEVVSFAVQKLKSYRYADDGEYLKSYFAYGAAGKGKYRIREELRRRKIPEEMIGEALADFEEDEEEMERLALKFLRGRTPDLKARAALYRHLAGRGYEGEKIRSVVNRVMRNEEE